jgi:hypothetical protein
MSSLTEDQIIALVGVYHAASNMPYALDAKSRKLREAIKEVRDAGFYVTFVETGSLGDFQPLKHRG